MKVQLIAENEIERQALESTVTIFNVCINTENSRVLFIFDSNYIKFLLSQGEDDTFKAIASMSAMVANSLAANLSEHNPKINLEQSMAKILSLLPEKFANLEDPNVTILDD